MNIAEGYLLACWFFGLCGTVDALLQPPSAFRAVERSKLKWIAIELAGTPLVGIFTYGYYVIKVRPALKRSGGRRPRALLRGLLAMMNVEFWQSASSRGVRPAGKGEPTQQASFSFMTSPQMKQCTGPGCHGGRVTCTSCGGAGRHIDYPGNVPTPRKCDACGGVGERQCHVCGGRGQVAA
jgi:hypothetical protein